MSAAIFGLFEMDPEAVWGPWRSMNPSLLNGLLVVGSMALVTGLALLWAIFLRKRRRRRHAHHHSHRHTSASIESPETPAADSSPAPPPKHRKWRRSHRRHRSRNPTRAETGGLPPVRSEGPAEPQT